MRSLDRFQRAALLTTVTTYLLIGVGGLVRASGAGLGCPDWPKCFGLWIPPWSVAGLPPDFDPALFNVFKTWTEYINRLLGAVTGLLVLVTFGISLVDHRRSPPIVAATLGALVLVVFNGWLGGVVVKSQLAPLVLTAHMVCALLVVGCLLYATARALVPRSRETRLDPERVRLGWVTLGAAALLMIQIGLGAFLRGEVQEVAKLGGARATWLAEVGWSEVIHQNFAVITTLAILFSAAGALRTRDPWLRRAAVTGVLLVSIQVAAGVGLSTLGFPALLQVVHLWAAALLVGALGLQAMFCWTSVPAEVLEIGPSPTRQAPGVSTG